MKQRKSDHGGLTTAESAELGALAPGLTATNETLADRTLTNESLLEERRRTDPYANFSVGSDYVRAAEAEAEAADLRKINSDTLQCAW